MQLPSDAMRAVKRDLRNRQKLLRDGLDDRGKLQLVILDRAEALIGGSEGPVVGYRGMGSELDPVPLLARLAGRGIRTGLPRIIGKGMPLVFHHWRPGDPLEPGPMGTQQPSVEARVIVPRILLVPLLAFDRRRYRLGYGGGFYDRTLERLRTDGRPQAIGVAFARQEVESVPVEPFDQPLDAIVTEREVIVGRGR